MNADLETLMVRAKQGDAAAQIVIARAFGGGNGVAQDFVQAFFWCKEAANQQHPEAMYILSESYRLGLGVEQDLVAAQKWHRRAILAGYKAKDRTPHHSLIKLIIKGFLSLTLGIIIVFLLYFLFVFTSCKIGELFIHYQP